VTPRPRPEEITPPERLERPSIVEWPSPQERREYSVRGMLAAAGTWFGIHLALKLGGFDLATVLAAALAIWLAVLLASFSRRAARQRRVEALSARGEATWPADWTGPRDALTSRMLRSSVPPWLYHAALVLGVPLAMVSFGTGPWAGSLPIAVAALVGSALLASWLVFRGGVQLKLDAFPCLVGAPATFWLATTPGAPRLEGARVLLQCVACPDCTACRKRTHLVVLWSRVWVAPAEGSPGPDEFVGVRFELPPYVLGTALHAKRPVRWELVVAGRTRWGPLVETFVVPVYAAPPQQAAS
jgi:hypothetical protein